GITVAYGAGRQIREIGPGAGLGEQLTPQLLTGEQRHDVPLLLLFGSRVENRRRGPADSDRVDRTGDTGGAQLLVDDQLMDGVGVQAVRLRPVRRDQTGLGELAPRW